MGFNSAFKGLNRKEWCLGSGRRRQLSQDRKEEDLFVVYLTTMFVACGMK